MKAKKLLINIGKTLILPVACWLVFAILTGGKFATMSSFMSVLRTSVVPILVAMSMSFGMNMGMLNFAAGAVVITSGIFAANISGSLGWGLPGVCLFCIAFAVLISAVNGVLYRVMRVPCLVLSLGFCMVVEAVPVFFYNSGTGAIKLTQAFLASSPWCFIVVGVMFVLFWYINSLTTFGADMRAIGSNIDIANKSGINIDRVKFLSYMISGVFLGVTAIMYLSNSVKLVSIVGFSSVGMIMDGFMGIFVASVFARYVDYSFAVVIGTITVRILGSGLVACGLTSEMRGVLTGFFLFVILVYSANAALPEKLKREKKIRAEALAAQAGQK